MQKTFRFNVILSFTVILILSLILPALYTRSKLQDTIIEEAKSNAIIEARQALNIISAFSKKTDELPSLVTAMTKGTQLRITIANNNGDIIIDSEVEQKNISELDNHSDRPEFINALRADSGVSIRYSNTLKLDMVYAAIQIPADMFSSELKAGGILRVAVPFSVVQSKINSNSETLIYIFISLVAIIAAFILGAYLSKRVEGPLSEMASVIQSISSGNYKKRLHIQPNSDFTAIANSVNVMADRIESSISDIKENKAQLRSILETMQEGVLVLGRNGKIKMVNKALINLFPKAEFGIGLNPIEVISSPELQKAIDELLSSSINENVNISIEIEPRRDLILNVHLVRPQIQSHDVVAVAVFHDVTETVRLMRIRRDFVANVSHELRTPLTAICGFAETLAIMTASEIDNIHKFSEKINYHANYMNRIVEDLLTLARLESTNLPLEITDVKLIDIVNGSATNLELQFKEKNLELKRELDENIIVKADAHFIGQVLRNLLENACRYSPNDSVIELSVKKNEQEIMISVHDNGVGIPEDEAGRIFERFYRIGVKKQNNNSTGLGLAICKHIVERHGGRIWAANTKGATICFTLPHNE